MVEQTMSTKPYDQAFKYLAEQDAEALLLLLGDLQPGQPAQITLLPREISVAAQLPDQPYEVVTAEGRRLVHVEAQTAYDHNLPDRMMDYGLRLWLKYRLPLTSYALLLTPRGVPKNLRVSRRVVAGDLRIDLHCRVVRLWRVSAQTALAWQRASLLPFVPLMRGGREALEPGAQRLREVADERQRRELGLHFLLLGGLRYDKIELLDLIGRESMIPLEQLKESSIYQYIKGEGFKEGIQQEAMTLLRRQLERRFGALPAWAEQKIEAADQATLEEWVVQLLEAKSLEEVFR
jgi:predicted transposase YdaD